MPELYGTLSATGVLNGTLQTIVYADNYNNLTNKPAINGHTLQGDQTASDLGLLTLADVPVESVNGQTGTVVLDGADIPYSAGVSVNDKIDAVEASIPSVPVLSVNGQTGTVVLDGADIEYGAGVSINDQIDNVAAQIPSIPVESVNGQTGVVDLDGSDINYNASTTINQRLDILYNAIPDVPVQSVNNKIGNVVLEGSDIAYNASYTVNDRIDYVEGLIEAGDVVSVNGQTGVVVLEGSDIEYSAGVTVNDQIGNNAAGIGTNAAAIGDLSTLTTSVTSSLVGAVNSMVIKTNAAWTANSSSAYGTALTDSINVTEGVWLITWGHPTQSANLVCYIDGIATNSDITDHFMSIDNGLAYTKGCMLVRFTGNSTIKLCAAASASVSFSDIGRGFLRAIKLK